LPIFIVILLQQIATVAVLLIGLRCCMIRISVHEASLSFRSVVDKNHSDNPLRLSETKFSLPECTQQ